MLFAVDRVNNKKERLKWETSKLSGVSYSEFGVGVNNVFKSQYKKRVNNIKLRFTNRIICFFIILKLFSLY